MNTLFLFLLLLVIAINGFMTGSYVSGEMRWQTGWSKWLLLAVNALGGFLVWTVVIPCLFIYVAFDEYIKPEVKFYFRVWFTNYYPELIKEHPRALSDWARWANYNSDVIHPRVKRQANYLVKAYTPKPIETDEMTESEYLECIGAANVWVVLIGCVCVSIGAGILKLILG
jgi:hypothetical protein